MTRFRITVRALVYLYFSVAAGYFVAGVLAIALALNNPRTASLTRGGWVAWLTAASFIAATLVFGQWEQFGRPLRLLKWVPLCMIATFLGVVGLTLISF
jgi:hypothetical protein